MMAQRRRLTEWRRRGSSGRVGGGGLAAMRDTRRGAAHAGTAAVICHEDLCRPARRSSARLRRRAGQRLHGQRMDVAANPCRAGGEPEPGWRRTRVAHARANAGLGGERRWLTLVPRGPPAAPERRGPTMVHRQRHSSDMDQPWSIVSSTLERHGPTMVHRQQHPSDVDQPWSIVSSTRATWTNHGPSSAAHSSDMDQPWSIVSSTRATWTNHGPSSAAPERRRPR